MKKLSFLARISLLLSVFFAFDKGLAILRQIIIARQFGISAELDAFNAANNLPDLLYAVISGGALSIAFIPVLSQVLSRDGRKTAWELFSRIANLAFLVTVGFSLVIALFAEPLVRSSMGIAPGFTLAQQQLVASLMRLNLIATLIFSISGLVMAGLQANQHFLLPAMSPLLYNLGQIFGALILAPSQPYQIGPLHLPAFGLGIHGLVYGVIIGAVLHLAIQIPGLVRFGFRWAPQLRLNDPLVRQVLRLLGPRVLTIFFLQLGFILRDNLASRLGTGPVTALTYGWMLMQVPETLIGTAIGTAMLPTLAEQAARADWQAFRDTVDRAMRVLFAVTLPVALLASLGIRPLIALAFHFDAAGTEQVVWVSRAFFFGIVAHSLIEVAARSFYAQQEARVPLLASGLCTLIYGGAALALMGPLGVTGIALANTIAFSAEALLLIAWLDRRLPGRFQWRSTLLRTLIATAVAGLLMVVLLNVVPAPEVVLAVGAAAFGALAALPFIWKEMRLLIRL